MDDADYFADIFRRSIIFRVNSEFLVGFRCDVSTWVILLFAPNSQQQAAACA
jgi:hypothetical protein